MLLQKLKKNRKGFTLIELIVVIAILAILAAIAVPNYIGMQAKAQKGVDIANATAIAGAINTFNAMQNINASPDPRITSAASAKGKLYDAADSTKNMWPTMNGGSSTAEADALLRVTVTNFVATVTTTIS